MSSQNSSIRHILILVVSLFLVASVTSTRIWFDQLSPSPSLSPSTHVSSDDLAFVSRICNNTLYPRLCLDTIVPSLNGHRVDLKFVIGVSIKAGDEYVKVALSAVNKLFESGGTSAVKEALKHCKDDFYYMAVNSYDEALDAFAMNSVPIMTSKLSAVFSWVDNCEDEFVYIGIASPMSDYAEKLTGLTSNCLSIIQQQ